jgi:hypothetical protein
MNRTFALMCGTFLIASMVACRDSVSHPSGRDGATGPNFVTTSDTGPGGCLATQCHFNERGAAANLNWFDPGTVAASDTGGGGGTIRFGFLSVGVGGSQALLFYQIAECDAIFGFCNVLAGGFGTISADDLSGNARQLQLRTNTTGNPNFFTYAGSSGSIAVDWVDNGLFEQRFNGTSERRQPGFREHIVGQSIDRSANASGSIVGLEIFPANQANISTSHNVTVDINR